MTINHNLTEKEKAHFTTNGFLIKKNCVALDRIDSMHRVVEYHLKNRIKPFELEQEVNYPGAPKSKEERGGDTIRRLLLAHSRHAVFNQWQLDSNVTPILKELLEGEFLYLVQSHHNCIMTKQPVYSSVTNWHKDTRYWDFTNQQLINTWLPLGDETIENGCLKVIPGSHLWNTGKERLDSRLFLRKDLSENQKWLKNAVNVKLNKGDLLFFHAALFHAAGCNKTQLSKNAVVSTYHSEKNQEIVNPFPAFQPVLV